MTRNPLVEKWFGITRDGAVRLVRVLSDTVLSSPRRENPGRAYAVEAPFVPAETRIHLGLRCVSFQPILGIGSPADVD